MTQTLCAGDESCTERRHDRAVVERRTEEHLGGAAGRIGERDDILDPAVVASPYFGCRFTDPTAGDHPEFKGLPCPASSR